MNSNNIAEIIKTFFEGSFSWPTQRNFRFWLRIDKDLTEKKHAMRNIWDNLPSIASDRTIEEYGRLQNRISLSGELPYKISKISLWRKFLKYASVLLLVISSGLVTYMISTLKKGVEQPRILERFVRYGERERLILPDGSVVWLNAGSLLLYPEHFENNDRTVYLTGEANFNISKNPDKRFVVYTQNLVVEALGTVFDVQSYPAAETVWTTLEEGRIKVSVLTDKGKSRYSTILEPDNQLTYSRLADKIVMEKVDAKSLGSWKEGYLIFRNASFEHMALKIEQKFNINIEYSPIRYAGRLYNVKFRPDETLEETMAVMAKLTGTSFRINGSVVRFE